MAEEQAIQQAIQAYLNTSNRPYNANNLIDEFAKKFKKPKVIKALQVLVSDYVILAQQLCWMALLIGAYTVYNDKFQSITFGKSLAFYFTMQEDSKEIQVKLFGKIKIYLADQKQFPVPSEAELKRIDSGYQTKVQAV